MEPPHKNGTLLYIVVVGAALLWIIYQSPFSTVVATEAVSLAPSAQGTIISVDAAGKEASVRLTTGETVRASVPPACIVFPGQIASLGSWGGGKYIVIS